MSDSQEDLRQRVIARYRLGESDEEVFNQLSETVATIFDVPIALLTVLRRDRQIFQGAFGINARESARESAICSHTVRHGDVFVVEDLSADPRFAENEYVAGPAHMRFYAGAPLTIGGVAIGSLCVLDRVPRQVSETQRELLRKLATTAANLIETRLGTVAVENREAELKRQARLFRTMLDSVDQGIAYFDSELRLTLWNDRYFELHGFGDEMKKRGFPAEEMLRTGIRWGLFGREVTQDDAPRMLEIIRTTPQSETVVETREGRTLHSVRRRIGEGEGYIVAVRDLTAERVAARAKDEFVSTVSHELRTPLTAIRGALALLGRALEGERSPRSQQMFDMAEKNAARLNTLIDDILDIERLARGQTSYLLVPLDMREVIEDAIEQNEPFATGLQIRLEDRVEEPLPLRGDPGRLLQVLTNLISNAARHSPAGSSVEIAGCNKDGLVRIEVRDRGSGVPENFVDRLFVRFAQAADSRRRGHGGTGLGLAISRAIVEQHGGRIGYAPRADGGACFWMELPTS